MQDIDLLPTWELEYIVMGHEQGPWINTPEEELRLKQAKKELKRRHQLKENL